MATRMQLKTPRLILRPAMKKDLSSIVEHLSNPLIAKTTLHIPHPYSKKDGAAWLKRNQEENKLKQAHTFVILWKRTGKVIGAMGLHPVAEHNRAEVGYWIAVPHWNKGVATEALIKILAYGFTQLGFNKIFATHMLNNKASGAVMIKAGMRKEGKLRDHYKKEDQYVSVIQYAMTQKEYQKQNQEEKRKPGK